MATITEQLAEWSTALSWQAAPQRVRDLCVSQLLAHLGALFGGARHPMGRRVVAGFGPSLSEDPARSAYVVAALTMALDYDDTVFAGHVSHSSVGVPLAYARSAGLDGVGLLRSILAATEVAARVTAAATLGPFRGQTAAHTHLAGAVAGRCAAQACGASTMVDALGIAFAQPPWPLNHAFFGSDAKLLTASTPIRTGLDAVEAASAGLRGAADILEHPEGFLARFATIPLATAATGGLGERWHTDTLSIKVHPGCAYIDGAIDAALRLHPQVAASFDQISAITVDASIFTVGMEQRAAPYLSGPSSGLAALNFSTGYSVAAALLRGGIDVEDFAAPRVADERVWRVARLVEVRHDAALSRRALLATAPIGAALRMAGDAAAGWLAAGAGIGEDEARVLLAEPEPGFEAAEKAIGARVRVVMRDGSEHVAEVDIAEGAAGPDTRARHREIAREKLVRNAAPLTGDAAAAEIADRVEGLPGAGAAEVAGLIDCLADGLAG